MKILFLDDDKLRHDTFDANFAGEHEIHHVYTAEQACKALENHVFDMATLDHDLCDWDVMSVPGETIERSGTDVAKFIAEKLNIGNVPKNIVIHSWNPAGALNMHLILKAAGIGSVRAPFSYSSRNVNFKP